MKTQEIAEIIKQQLGRVFTEKDLRAHLLNLDKSTPLAEYTKKAIIKKAHKVSTRWNQRVTYQFRTFAPIEKITQYDVLEALTFKPKNYISHFSALYLLGLINQRPKAYYVSQEVLKTHISPPLSDLKIRQAFMKESRSSSHYFTYESERYFLIQRTDYDEIGITQKQIPSTDRVIVLKITDKERTLLDCCISPQYAGGIPTLLKVFSETSLDIEKLAQYYRKINPIYPIWQRIGFILEKTKSTGQAQAWRAQFPSLLPQTFFLDHGFRSEWKFSETWKIYYPENIIR